MNGMNRAAKRYCRAVRSWLPQGKMRRRIMGQLYETVGMYMELHPHADFEELQTRLGPPMEIAASYVESMDTAELLRTMHVRRRVMAILAAALFFFLLLWSISVVAAGQLAFHGPEPTVYNFTLE